ncbi:unnamed protein product [Ilex paraguariensis]|uniref:RNase H type-1 domain-containing protein n=1 Tax=Ilex paraguariensis TaxID=185542 RepID=A0ABC8TPC6_9AQUA
MGAVKINFDGAIFSSIKAVGIGVVIRDWRGRFCAGLSRLIRRPLSVESVETLAACCALDLGRQLGYSSIVLEGDALSVVEAIGKKEPNLSEAGHLIELIQSSTELLMDFSSSWVWRSANGVADALAHYACQCTDSALWRGVCPYFIGPLILRESSS